MTRADALHSFRDGLRSGESRAQAHATVWADINALLAELVDDGLPSTDIRDLLIWWTDVDYRTIPG